MTTIQITRASDVLPAEEVAALQPTIDEINRLKAERKAIVAAHNYMMPGHLPTWPLTSTSRTHSRP